MNKQNTKGTRREIAILVALFLVAVLALPAIAQPNKVYLAPPTTRGTKDITVQGDLRIICIKQTVGVNWGGSITLSKGDCTWLPSQQKYSVDLVYAMVNNGTIATGSFNNRILNNGGGISGVFGQTLNAGEVKTAHHVNVLLDAGGNDVTLLLDDANGVAETDENNNKFGVKITIQ